MLIAEHIIAVLVFDAVAKQSSYPGLTSFASRGAFARYSSRLSEGPSITREQTTTPQS